MENSNKGFLSPLIIFIAVLFLAGVSAGVYYKNKQKSGLVQAPVVATSTTNTVTQAPVVAGDTVSWKTYANKEDGIELKYPADLNDIKGSPYITLLDVGKYGKKQDLQFYFTLFTVNDRKSCSADTYTQKLLQDNKNATRSEIKLADSLLTAWRVEANSQPFGNTGEIYISSKNCGNVFRIESGSGPLSSYDKNLFNEILQTIKFTKATVVNETANWKTYTGDKYGFSLSYPKDARINDVDISGGRNISFMTPQGMVMVEVVTAAWHNGVLSTPANCNDFDPGIVTSHVAINGVDFLKGDVSRDLSGMNSATSATEYCTMQNGTGYKIISRMPVTPGSNSSSVNNNFVLNQVVKSFTLLK